jgi:adenosine deaminase
MRPGTVRELASANGLAPPALDPPPYRGLDNFLGAFAASCSCLVTRQDFSRASYEAIEDLADAGVRHVEMFFSPVAHTDRGVSIDTVYEGLRDGIRDARADFGITCGLILNVDKRRGTNGALELVEYAATKKRDDLIGIGAGNRERGIDHRQFAAAWHLARRLGLHRTCHAGEDGPVENIRICVDDLGCERIDHGVCLLDDPALTSRVVSEQIPFTACPTSNILVAGCVRSIGAHPLRAQRDAGVKVTVNSDDPSLLGIDIADEYFALFTDAGLDLFVLEELSLDSIEASWLDEERKLQLRNSFLEEFDNLRHRFGMRPRADPGSEVSPLP